MTIDIVSASVLSYIVCITQNIEGSVYNTWKMRIQYEKDDDDFCLKGGGTSMVEDVLPVYHLVQACPSSIF